MTDHPTRMAYIARTSCCNAVVAATMDDPAHKRDVSRAVSRWIRDGFTVERVPSDQVGALFGVCTCDQTKPTQQRLVLSETDFFTESDAASPLHTGEGSGVR